MHAWYLYDYGANMINIGCLYKDNDCIFVAEQILPKIDDERYVLCYKTQLLREDFLRGVTNAYVKCEKPFTGHNFANSIVNTAIESSNSNNRKTSSICKNNNNRLALIK